MPRKPRTQIAWDKNPKLVDEFEKVLKAGMTATEAAKHLTRKFGLKISRASVIGRASRQDIYFKTKPTNGKKRAPKSERRGPPSRARTVNAVLKVTGHADLRQRSDEPKPLGNDDQCQWLHGEPTKRFFCGHPKTHGSSYCSHHHVRRFGRNNIDHQGFRAQALGSRALASAAEFLGAA